MRKLYYTFLLLGIVSQVAAQLSFENLPLNGKNYWKGDSGISATNFFQAVNGSQYAKFKNRNDTSSGGDYWSGYAFSKLKDSNSLSYITNDCAAFPASGYNGSDVYVVAYENTWNTEFNTIILNKGIQSMYVTNSTIAYRSMQNGDGWAKKFGGASGNDPDYFRIIFQGWQGGNLLSDTVQFYLADFRDSNNVNDYILNTWRKVDLGSKFFNADSLTYHLESSDTNSFGILTPAYFCLDQIELTPLSVHNPNWSNQVQLYPNPCGNSLTLQQNTQDALQVSCYALNGALIEQFEIRSNQPVQLNTEDWASGLYAIIFHNGKEQTQLLVNKQ